MKATPFGRFVEAAAKLSHFALYALLVVVPFFGILVQLKRGHSLPIFGYWEFVSPWPANRPMARTLIEVHEVLADALLILAGIHAAAALLHTLQGTAGTVGAMSLVNYAAGLEKQLLLAGNTASVKFSPDEFDAVIRHSCNELHVFSEKLDSESTTSIMRLTVLDKPRLARLLDELDELMRGKNMRATNVFDELRFTCGIALGDKLADLEQAMNDLDFPLSLERTRSLRESLK